MAPPAAGGPVKLTFAALPSVPFTLLDEIIGAFEETYGGQFTVEKHYDATGDPFKSLNKFRSGTAEDMSWSNDDIVFFLASAGMLLILDDYVERDLNREDYWKRVWILRTAPGGEVAALNHGSGQAVYHYNKKMFADAGLTAPADWAGAWTVDEWEANLTKMTKRSGDKTEIYGAQLPTCGYLFWMPYTGISFYNADETAAQFNHPEIVKFYERLVGWFRDKKIVLPLGENAMELFNAGKVAIVLGGGPTYKSVSEDIEWGYMPPFKHKVDPTLGIMGDETYSIPAGSKVRDAAWEMNKFFMSEDAQWMYANSDALMPSMTKVRESERYRTHLGPDRRMLIDVYENGWLTESNHPMGDLAVQMICVEDSAMAAGKETVQGFLDKRTERMNQYIKDVRWNKANNVPGWRLPGLEENMGKPMSIPAASPYKMKS
jgi:ABC-type glycerol-3-phosphate transport system substrate-binding protein